MNTGNIRFSDMSFGGVALSSLPIPDDCKVDNKGVSVIDYAVAGLGRTVIPSFSVDSFGWYATISCVVGGTCS